MAGLVIGSQFRMALPAIGAAFGDDSMDSFKVPITRTLDLDLC